MALVTTLNSMTEKFWTSEKITDAVSRGHPCLEALFRRAKAGGGTKLKFDVEYNLQQGGWRALTGQMTATSPEIVAQGEMDWRDVYVWAKMEKAYVYQNRHDPKAVASYFDVRVRNAVKSMKQRYLAPAMFTAQSVSSWDSLVDAINDSTPYANIATGDLAAWRSLIGEGAYGNPATPVSPSIENFQKMIRTNYELTGENYDLIVTSGAVYDVLKAQVQAMNSFEPIQTKDGVKIGFSKLFIDDVPVISDPWFTAAQCSAFDSTKATRAACLGHQALFINWDYIYLMYLPEWYMKWNDEGWRSPIDYTQLNNDLHCASNIVCTSRRNQGRLFGIDPTQADTAWTLIPDAQINTAQFAIPAEI